LKGNNRRGKIWGDLVPYGLTNLGPTCTQCPWRAGANENTVFTTSNDVTIQGQKLPAGTYGVHMIPGKDQWTVIFSKVHTAWGSFSYDAKEDALRVQTKAGKSDYHEWLTYEFITREPTQATLALEWEDLKVPVAIAVENAPALYAAAMESELRGSTGFDWHNVQGVADYLVAHQVDLPQALKFAQQAADPTQGGDDNVGTLMTLADAQAANGQKDEASKTTEKALASPSAKPMDLHVIGRKLLGAGKKDEAVKVFQFNAQRFPDQWPVHVGLMRGFAALGDAPKALAEGKLAQKQAPDELNRKSLEHMVKLLQAGNTQIN
jgi:tetratricopeptide (TPR) repeat protein